MGSFLWTWGIVLWLTLGRIVAAQRPARVEVSSVPHRLQRESLYSIVGQLTQADSTAGCTRRQSQPNTASVLLWHNC